MSLVRYHSETQRAFVERTLREEGRIATFDAVYETTYPDGSRTSVTRLAAIIHALRLDGWPITTADEHARLATYLLPRPAAKPEPGYHCTVCGGAPSGRQEQGLGGTIRARCHGCGGAFRMFTRRAA